MSRSDRSSPMSASPARQWHLVTLGDLVLDLVVPIPSLPLEAGQHQRAAWKSWEAGGTSNTLIMASRLGLRTVAVGAMGQDHEGRLVADILTREGVALEGLVFREDQATPTAIVIVDEAGHHVFVGTLDPVPALAFQPVWQSIVHRSATLFTTGYAMHPSALFGPDNTLRCMQEARHSGCRIYMDLGPPAFIVEPERVAAAVALADVLLATEDEICHWMQEPDPLRAARAILANGPEMVVAKAGAAGCRIVTAQTVTACPGFPVEARDTAGAGDAFAAGFIAACLEARPWAEAGMIANAVGATSVMRVGTGSLLPSQADVEALLATRQCRMPQLRQRGVDSHQDGASGGPRA